MDLKEILSTLKSGDGQSLITEALEAEVTTLFEVAVKEKADALIVEKEKEIRAVLEEKQKAELLSFKEQLTERVASYLDYAAAAYVKKNRVVVEKAIAADFQTTLLERVVSTFRAAGVDLKVIPSGKAIARQISEAKAEAGAAQKAAESARATLVKERALSVFGEETNGLADADVKRVYRLCEDYDINDTDAFRSKVKTVVEAVRKAAVPAPAPVVEKGEAAPAPAPAKKVVVIESTLDTSKPEAFGSGKKMPDSISRFVRPGLL
jgi:hypothetical protein